MAENLKKTLLIENKEYNINAVHSDEADHAVNADNSTLATTAEKVQASLVLKKSLSNRTAEESFNGSESKTLEYVPATGGKYRGPVLIETDTTDYTSAYNSLSDTDKKKTIFNAGQFETKVADLAGAPLYTWNTSYQLCPVQDKNNNDYKLNAIVGTSQDFEVFKKLLTGGSKGLKFETVPNGADYSYRVSGLQSDVDWDVVIPYVYAGKPVTEIKGTEGSSGNWTRSAFYENPNVRSVVIPDSVKTIGMQAFNGCTGLISVRISNNVTTINNATFSGCKNLTSIKLGSNLKTIIHHAFSGCSSLKSIIIPEGVTTIEEGAFNGCYDLKSAVIPKSVTTIGRGIFDIADFQTDPLKVYYAGSESQWNALIASSAVHSENVRLRAATVEYNYKISSEDTSSGSAVEVSEISDNPFIYICKDEESANAPASNKMFLKLPGYDEIIEISKGAARLESANSTATTGYYTYETLAAIIAGINTRLAGLGLNAIPLPDFAPVPEVLPDYIPEDNFDPDAVPTIDTLNAAIVGLNTEITNIKNGPTIVSKATSDEEGRNIKTGYYRTDNTTNANKITITTSIPTSTTGYSNGDICIVIA
jgi:hypothetical protein